MFSRQVTRSVAKLPSRGASFISSRYVKPAAIASSLNSQSRTFKSTPKNAIAGSPSPKDPLIDTINAPAQPIVKRIPEFSLKDKVILVTGAGRGLGLTVAEAILEAGGKVYGLDRLDEPVCAKKEIVMFCYM